MLSSDKYNLPFELRPYQEEGIKFLSSKDSALIADEMGLGKTVQTIIAIRNIMKKEGMKKVLIIVPSALKSNWFKEFEIWGGIIPKIVDDYNEENVSHKVVKIILSYIDYINRTVWRKDSTPKSI